jgi:hypothetical protein
MFLYRSYNHLIKGDLNILLVVVQAVVAVLFVEGTLPLVDMECCKIMGTGELILLCDVIYRYGQLTNQFCSHGDGI